MKKHYLANENKLTSMSNRFIDLKKKDNEEVSSLQKEDIKLKSQNTAEEDK